MRSNRTGELDMKSLRFALAAAAWALTGPAFAQQPVKGGLDPVDWVYKLGDGVTSREVTYYSDDVPCYAKIFFPKNYDPKGKTPGIVLGQGWAGTHFSIEKYAARFAERGLVAMAIDYRGWGWSNGFAVQPKLVAQPGWSTETQWNQLDSQRVTKGSADVTIKRLRLIPLKQVEDYRNAISYLQGEAGVDPDRIGIWGSSFAGGNSIVVAALDARVKAISIQVPAIAGKGVPEGPLGLQGAMLQDAIKRAREGQGAEMTTGFSVKRQIDVETNQMVREFRPFHYLKKIEKLPVQFIVAEKEQLFRNQDNAYAAAEVLTGPKKVISVPGITHFEMYINEAFEISSNAAADWFREHLGMK
jgi:dienelactone hydrolase